MDPILFAAIGLQVAAVAVLALVAWAVSDGSSAWFLVLGGAAAILPNGLFALRLMLHRKRAPESYPVVFFLGDAIKILMTVGLLGLIVKTQDGIRWLPLLIGFIVALKAPLFALLVTGGERSGADGGRRDAAADEATEDRH